MSFFFSAESPVKNIPGNVPASCIGQQNEYICHTCRIVNDTIPAGYLIFFNLIFFLPIALTGNPILVLLPANAQQNSSTIFY